MFRFAIGLFLILSMAQLTGCAMFYKYEAISEQPAREGANAPLLPRISSIQPSLSVPLAMLQTAANNAVDQVLPRPDSGSETIGRIEIEYPWGGCLLCASLDVNWNYVLSKPNPISFKGQGGDRLLVTFPAAIDGKAGFGGDLADLFSLDEKNFKAALNFEFGTSLKNDVSFCPKLVNASATYAWTTPAAVEIIGENCIFGACIGPWWLDLSKEVDAELAPMVQSVGASLENAITCAPVRESLAKVWQGYSFPVKLPYEDLYLNITPKAMHLPGLAVNSTDILIAGRLDAEVSLDATPNAITTLPLPPNNPLPISPGRFSVAAPISTQYYTFEALVKQALDGKKFTSSEPLGGLVVTPTQVTLYPTAGGSALAIGVSVAVEFKYLFFLNTSGTVWLTAKPVAIDNGRRLRISDLKVTRKFSNGIWDIASVLLDDQVTQAVQQGFELDLNPPLKDAESQITNLINQAGQGSGITLTASDIRLGVGRLLANDKAFQLEVIFDAMVDAKLGQVSLR